MRTELVSVPTDTVPLEGAYYEPEGSAITGCAILLHGNCMNFYVGAPRFLPPHLTGMGLACLAFNRRGHDVLSTRDSRELEGGAFQTTAEAIADNDYARAWIEEKGYGPPAVIGHSNGGMLSVRHVADHPDTPAMVLLSAHRGGKEIARLASANGLWAQDRLAEISELARDLVDEGRGDALIILPGWWRATTAESAVDYLDNVPDILDYAPKIECPVLYLRGDQESPALYPVEEFTERCKGPCEAAIIPDCNHFYTGSEGDVAGVVTEWLKKTL